MKTLKFSPEIIEELFPAGKEGTDVKPSIAATARAAAELGVPWTEIQWHAPDVFDVRYGSSYVATAFSGNKKVRFLSTEGNFRIGDDL